MTLPGLVHLLFRVEVTEQIVFGVAAAGCPEQHSEVVRVRNLLDHDLDFGRICRTDVCGAATFASRERALLGRLRLVVVG
jgi:hypothetical protein